MSDSSALMSVILATDNYETIRPVIERLRRQTVRDQIEIVLVAPTAGDVGEIEEHAGEFAGVRVVEHDVGVISAARAAGIRAATAPIVFIGETHTYAHPGFTEALLAAMEGPWSVVTPCFGNANPKGALSWSAFLFDYGLWSDGLPAGEIADAPTHNIAYRRSELIELGERLQAVLDNYDNWKAMMNETGRRIYFEPAARIDHLNVATAADWMSERWVSGVIVGAHRARRWSPARRLAYAAASALVPPVLLWRMSPGVRRAMRHNRLPVATIPAVIAAAIIKGAGELWGCLTGTGHEAGRQMHEYELHKVAYSGRGKA